MGKGVRSGWDSLSGLGGGWMSKLEKYFSEIGIGRRARGDFDPRI